MRGPRLIAVAIAFGAGIGSVEVPPGAAATGPAGRVPVWKARDSTGRYEHDAGESIALSPDGSVAFVAGAAQYRLGLWAHDTATGARRWRAIYPGPEDLVVRAPGVALSPDGSLLFVAAIADLRAGGDAYVVVAYQASNGAFRWATYLPSPAAPDVRPSIAANPDGSLIYVTGANPGPNLPGYDTVALDAAGNVRWESHYDGAGTGQDAARGIAVGPNGTEVFVTGESDGGSTGYDAATVSYNAQTGHQRWAARFDAGADDRGVALALGRSAVFVAASSAGVTTNIVTAKYRAGTGAFLGSVAFDDGADEAPVAMAADASGRRVFIAATSGAGIFSRRFLTLSYSSDLLGHHWARTYTTSRGRNAPAALAVTPDGSTVVVTGVSENGRLSCEGDIPSADYATLAYDAVSGARRWLERFSGTSRAPDSARAVAVGPDGSRAYVTGSSDEGCATAGDVATLAYQLAP